MKEWVRRILKVAKVLMGLSQVLGVGIIIGGVISPVYFWLKPAKQFFSSDDVVILDGVVKMPTQALQHFPFHLFLSLYGLSFILTGIAIFLSAKVMRQIFDNLLAEQYFTNSNRLLFKSYLKVQVLALIADIVTAIANTLASTQLHRTPSFLYSVGDWESDIYELVILIVIYYIFTKGLALKQDADLTI